MRTGYQQHRSDAAQAAFVNQALEYISAQVTETLIPPLDGMRFVPMTPAPDGAESFAYYMLTRTGIAQFCAGGGQDIPEADVFMQKFVHHFKNLKSSYGYTVEELAAAGFAMSKGYPLNLQTEKANAAKQDVFQAFDAVAALGSAAAAGLGADVGFVGLANHPNATIYTIPNGAGGSPLWSLKAPDEVIADMGGISAAQVAGTFKVHRPTKWLLPVAAFEDITNRRMGDGSDETILSYFVKTRAAAGHPVTVESWARLDSAGSGSTGRMIAYDPKPDNLEHPVAELFAEGTPELHRERWWTPVRGRSAGVVVRRPLSISYGDGITPTP